MNNIAEGAVIMMDMGIYWVCSMVVFQLVDLYVKKKLGKAHAGYRILRIPKFCAMAVVSLFTIAILIWAKLGLSVSGATLTYFGVPYFVAWVFFLVNAIGRVKAEKGKWKGKGEDTIGKD